MNAEFWEYELLTRWDGHDEPLCLGERIKKGTFRPCHRQAIPFSSIVGALRSRLGMGLGTEIIAAGYLTGYESEQYSVIAPSDVALGTVKPPAPISVQFLRGAKGRVFVDVSDSHIRSALEAESPEFEITLGAMKSTGFGRCLLRRSENAVPMEPVKGKLLTRIPEKLKDRFGIEDVFKPVYGYLFEPSDVETGKYVKALCEDSEVRGCRFLVKGSDE